MERDDKKGMDKNERCIIGGRRRRREGGMRCDAGLLEVVRRESII